MAAITPDEGELQMLCILLGAEPPEATLDLCLFVNDRAPQLTDTVANYTEMSTHGYAKKVLAPGEWATTPATVGPPKNTPALGSGAKQSFLFTITAPQVLVYGWLLVSSAARKIWLVERFTDGPYKVQAVNDEVAVTPEFTLRSEYP